MPARSRGESGGRSRTARRSSPSGRTASSTSRVPFPPCGTYARRKTPPRRCTRRTASRSARSRPSLPTRLPTAATAAIRSEMSRIVGDDLARLKAGSAQALRLKEVLIEQGAWSQYLEVGIRPDAEIFSKAQPMSAVGTGLDAGIHPMSTWNNPEPEVVVVAASSGRIVAATLGNDVNLRDVEGRSALLLGKCKDNNA